MIRLRPLSRRQVIRALTRAGFTEMPGRGKGSHRVFVALEDTQEPRRRVTVPDQKTIKRGTLASIIQGTGLAREEFFDLV